VFFSTTYFIKGYTPQPKMPNQLFSYSRNFIMAQQPIEARYLCLSAILESLSQIDGRERSGTMPLMVISITLIHSVVF